jgi:hypothetical protein
MGYVTDEFMRPYVEFDACSVVEIPNHSLWADWYVKSELLSNYLWGTSGPLGRRGASGGNRIYGIFGLVPGVGVVLIDPVELEGHV